MTAHIDSEDCQGNRQNYYRAKRVDSTGRYILATANSAEEAELKVEIYLQEREAFLRLPLLDQLRILTHKENMDWIEVKDSVKLIAQILLEQNSERA